MEDRASADRQFIDDFKRAILLEGGYFASLGPQVRQRSFLLPLVVIPHSHASDGAWLFLRPASGKPGHYRCLQPDPRKAQGDPAAAPQADDEGHDGRRKQSKATVREACAQSKCANYASPTPTPRLTGWRGGLGVGWSEGCRNKRLGNRDTAGERAREYGTSSRWGGGLAARRQRGWDGAGWQGWGMGQWGRVGVGMKGGAEGSRGEAGGRRRQSVCPDVQTAWVGREALQTTKLPNCCPPVALLLSVRHRCTRALGTYRCRLTFSL